MQGLWPGPPQCTRKADGAPWLSKPSNASNLDWQAARLEAIRLAGDILKHDAHRIVLGEDRRIAVTDGAGLILLQMTFCVVETPAMRREPLRGAQVS
jgi:hypothetical protein